MTDTLKLFAFTCGWFQAPVEFFVEGGGSKILRSPVPAYLIDHPTGGLALFDTGLGLRHRREADFRLAPEERGFEFDDNADIGVRLRHIGVDPAKVKWIINSHFHVDHCGGNASIPNATVIIQSRELAYARSMAGQGPLYMLEDFDRGHPQLAIDGEHDLYGDGSVMLFPTYGHTPGHQSARVKLASGDVVLTADCCYLKRSLDDLALPPHTFDTAAALDTLKNLAAMRAKGARIFYGHDGEFWPTIRTDTAIV